MLPTSATTFWAHLGLELGAGTQSGSKFDWTSSSIPKTYSTWFFSSDYEYETLIETLSYAKGLGRMNLPSLSNGSWYYTRSENGRKCENSCALEAWFATPFAIIFQVEISKISIESRSNKPFFGEPIWVIWYTENEFIAKEGR